MAPTPTPSPQRGRQKLEMNALRLTEGFAVRKFGERTGLPVSSVEQALTEAETKGLITRDHLRIAPTARGRVFLNDLLQLFL